MRTSLIASLGLTLALLGAVAAGSSRVQVVRHWDLYAATGPGKPYHLFLGPFAAANPCELDEKAIYRAGGRAYCTSGLTLSFDRERESQLFWEYFGPGAPWNRLCGYPS